MKKLNLLCVLLIAACLAIFYGYRAAEQLSSDTKAPKIEISAEALQVSVLDPRTALLQGVTARDNADGDVTASVVVESARLLDSEGTVSVTYAAFDKAGNVAKATREVRYSDYVGPRFSLHAPLIFTQGSGVDVLSRISAEDMLDGDISHRIRATSLDEMAITTLGTHDVQFRVTNDLGDTTELVLPVEIKDTGTALAGLTLTDYLIYLPVGAAFNAQSYLDTFTRSGESISLRNGMPQNHTLRTTGTVDTGTPGVYAVTYLVSYVRSNESGASLNQSYTGQSRLIVVVEG